MHYFQFSWPLYDASCFEWCWWCEDNAFHWYVLFPSRTNTPRDDNLGSYIDMATRLCWCYVEAYGHWYRWLVWLRRSDVENGKIRLGAGLTTFPSWFDTNIRRGISLERLGELIPHRLDVSSISTLSSNNLTSNNADMTLHNIIKSIFSLGPRSDINMFHAEIYHPISQNTPGGPM